MAQIVSHNPASVHAPSSGYSMGLELASIAGCCSSAARCRKSLMAACPKALRRNASRPGATSSRCSPPPASASSIWSRSTTFLTDRSQVVANRAIRRKMLAGNEPASTVMIAETVDGKWLLEIEAIAAE